MLTGPSPVGKEDFPASLDPLGHSRWMIDQRTVAWRKRKQTKDGHGKAHAATDAALHYFNALNSRCLNYYLGSHSQYEGGLKEQN